MNQKNQRNRRKRMRALVLWMTLCLALMCGAVPASAASGKPGRVKILSVKRRPGGKVQVKYKRVPKADGYQIMLATNKKFTSGKIVANVRKGKTTSKTVKGLATWKKYYVRVRAYRKSGRKKVCGKWSKIRAVEPGVYVYPEDSGDEYEDDDDDSGYEDDDSSRYEDDENDETERQPSVETETEPPLPPELEKPDDYYEGKPEDREATAWGFNITVVSYNILHKVEKSGNGASRTEDGNHIYTMKFLCDGGENWLKSVDFEAEDVTPAPYQRMYEAMGVQGGVISQSEEISTSWGSFGYIPRVMEPLDDSPMTPPEDMKYAESFVKLTIKARMATRVIKLTAKKDGEILDTVYLTASGHSPQNRDQYASQDLELYEAVRRRVEAKLWKPGMTNLEKLKALQEYINTTSHYPDMDVTKKKYNPTFWENWSVDGIDLYDNMAGDTILNKTMALQGGTTKCLASSILLKAATEDLGLQGIASKDKATAGEGVWVGMGSASTNPGNPWHETFYYQDPEGKAYSLDAQGLMLSRNSGKVTCEAHQCREKIVSLR